MKGEYSRDDQAEENKMTNKDPAGDKRAAERETMATATKHLARQVNGVIQEQS